MSRTIRRKGYSRGREGLLYDTEWTDNFSWLRRFYIDPKSPEGRKLLSMYHSDAGKFMGNAPGWYRNIFERSARQLAKRQLHRYTRNPENLSANTGHQVLIDPNHHRNATWCWW